MATHNLPYSGLDDFFIDVASPPAFNGGTANARGNDGGTSDPLTLFTVTGDVEVGVIGVCTEDLVSAGGGTVSVGLTNNSTLFMEAQPATNIDANEIWVDSTPAIGKPIDSLSFYIVGNGQDIVEYVGTANITSGQIYYIALWKPLSPNSSVIAV